MIEPATIEGLFRNLDTYVEQLELLARLSQEELAGDLVKLGAAKYYLQVAVECCIDVANHIIARQGFRAPESYADSFAVLVENGILEESFGTIARKMARMRNRLVHLYWEVDAEVLYETLQHNIGDLGRFKAYIICHVQAMGLGQQANNPGAA